MGLFPFIVLCFQLRETNYRSIEYKSEKPDKYRVSPIHIVVSEIHILLSQVFECIFFIHIYP